MHDKDGQEIDLVMTLGDRTWGMEVKATSTPGRSAGRGMARLAALCGDVGIVRQLFTSRTHPRCNPGSGAGYRLVTRRVGPGASHASRLYSSFRRGYGLTCP